MTVVKPIKAALPPRYRREPARRPRRTRMLEQCFRDKYDRAARPALSVELGNAPSYPAEQAAMQRLAVEVEDLQLGMGIHRRRVDNRTLPELVHSQCCD